MEKKGRNAFFAALYLCNANMKPSRLKEHFDNMHGEVKPGQDSESLKNKRVRFDASGTLQNMGFVSANKSLLLASYKVAYEIAKNKNLIPLLKIL